MPIDTLPPPLDAKVAFFDVQAGTGEGLDVPDDLEEDYFRFPPGALLSPVPQISRVRGQPDIGAGKAPDMRLKYRAPPFPFPRCSIFSDLSLALRPLLAPVSGGCAMDIPDALEKDYFRYIPGRQSPG